MKRLSLSAITNTLILSVLIFAVIYIILLFVSVPTVLRYAVSILLSVCFGSLIFLSESARAQRQKTFSAGKRNTATVNHALSVMPLSESRQIIMKLLKAHSIESTSSGRYVFTENGSVVILCFLPEEITANAVKEYYDQIPNEKVSRPVRPEKVFFISCAFSANAVSVISELGSNKIDASVFAKEILELSSIALPLNAKHHRKKTEKPFQKINGFRLIFYGAILIMMSYIVFYPVYYVISGTLFIILGITVRLLNHDKPLVKSENAESFFQSVSDTGKL